MMEEGNVTLAYAVHFSMTLMGLLNALWMKEGTTRVIKYHKKYFGGAKTDTGKKDIKKD